MPNVPKGEPSNPQTNPNILGEEQHPIDERSRYIIYIYTIKYLQVSSERLVL